MKPIAAEPSCAFDSHLDRNLQQLVLPVPQQPRIHRQHVQPRGSLNRLRSRGAARLGPPGRGDRDNAESAPGDDGQVAEVRRKAGLQTGKSRELWVWSIDRLVRSDSAGVVGILLLQPTQF